MSATAELHPNQVAQELTGRDYVSFSAISTFQQCPLKYFFRYVEGLPEEVVSSSLIFGGAIHRAAELHFRELLHGNQAPTIDTLLSAYEEAWTDRDDCKVAFGKSEDRASLDDLARRVLGAFQASNIAQPSGTIVGIEEELTGELVPGVPDLLARVDLLVDEGDALVVTDLKTSRSRWSREKAEEASEQLLLYHELARELIPDKPVTLRFVVLTKTKSPVVETHVTEVSPQRIARLKRTVEAIWRSIESRMFYPAPSAMSCGGCPFREPCRSWTG